MQNLPVEVLSSGPPAQLASEKATSLLEEEEAK